MSTSIIILYRNIESPLCYAIYVDHARLSLCNVLGAPLQNRIRELAGQILDQPNISWCRWGIDTPRL